MTALDLDHGHAAAALATADTSHSVETPISPTGPADLTAKLAAPNAGCTHGPASLRRSRKCAAP